MVSISNVGGPRVTVDGMRGICSVRTGFIRRLAYAGAAVLFAVLDFDASAQQLPSGITAEQVKQQILQQQQIRAPASAPAVTSQVTQLDAATTSTASPAPSNLERAFSARAGMQLKQFGYEQLGVGRSVPVAQMGALQDDYILGPGDEIIVSLRGQENAEFRTTVDRDGRVSLPKTVPIAAAGRTLADFRRDLNDVVRAAYVETKCFVTIGQMRQVSVLVSGEVGVPGVRTVTGLSTAVDAILLSGGVNKSGSLRNIKILRGQREISVDLYTVLMGRVSSKLVTLADGDKIIVPTIGATVAVAGQTKRAAIYELPPGRQALSSREAVAMAAGTTMPGAYAISLLRMQPDGKRQFIDVSNAMETTVHDGEVVFVKNSVDISVNRVVLEGAVRTPGFMAIGKYKTLHDVLPSLEVLQPGAYLLFGIIQRIDPATLQQSALPFSPLRVINGRENVTLLSEDRIRILSKNEAHRLVKKIRARSTPAGDDDDAAKSTPKSGHETELTAAGGPEPKGAEKQSGRQTEDEEAPNSGSLNAVISDTAFYGNTLDDNRVTAIGAFKEPGDYLVAPGTTFSELLRAIGGLVYDVDLSEFVLTTTMFDNKTGMSTTTRTAYPATEEQFASLILRPYDRIEFHRVYSDKSNSVVTIGGEVRYPGSYSILRGEKLSSLLRRAGGLTEGAYPEGAVFRRASVAAAEQSENSRILIDMRSQLLSHVMRAPESTQQTQGTNAETIMAMQGLIKDVASMPALGRVPVVADPDMIAKHSDLDIALEAEDNLFIPKTPVTVLVLGEVQRPGALLVNSARSPDEFVDRAGGTTADADTSRIIVVLPDGTVQASGSSWLNFGFDGGIPAGSTIYVPRKLETYSLRSFFVDTIQVVSQLATTAAALSVLSTSLSK